MTALLEYLTVLLEYLDLHMKMSGSDQALLGYTTAYIDLFRCLVFTTCLQRSSVQT